MMKLTITAGDLARTLRLAARVVERKNTIPIFAYAALTVANGKASLRVTDLDIELRLDVPAMSLSDGAVALPVRSLLSLVKEIAADDLITITYARETGAHLVTGTARYPVATLPEAGFPEMKLSGEPTAIVEFAEPTSLARALRTCLPFVSTEETRYYLNGCYFDLSEPQAYTVATDGHTLGRTTVDCTVNRRKAEDNPSPIIHTKTCRLLIDLPITGRMRLYPTALHVPFAGGDLYSKTIDGTYPAYRRVYPENRDWSLTIEPETISALKAAVTRVNLTVNHENASHYKSPVGLVEAPGAVVVAAQVNDLGSKMKDTAYEVVSAATSLRAASFIGGFNATLLLKVLTTARTDVVTLHSKAMGTDSQERDYSGPILITSHDGEFLIMPMRIEPEATGAIVSLTQRLTTNTRAAA